MADSPHSEPQGYVVPQHAIREPLGVIHEYAMLGAGNVSRRRAEVLAAENAVIEKYARLEEQNQILFAALTAIQQAAGVEHSAEDFESFAYATSTAVLNGVRHV